MLGSLISNILQWKFQSFIHTNENLDSPSQMLRSKFMQMKNNRKPNKKKEVMVEVPESRSYLDPAIVPMVLTIVAIVLFMKIP